MTAVLSPAEQQEVARFGIHDPEAFEQIIEHGDDVLPCVGKCGRPAVLRVTSTCRHDSAVVCLSCYQNVRDYADRAGGTRPVQCGICGQVWPIGSTFDDIYEVGQL